MAERGKKLTNEELQQANGGYEIPKACRFQATDQTNADGWTKCNWGHNISGNCAFCTHYRTSSCVDGYHQPHA